MVCSGALKKQDHASLQLQDRRQSGSNPGADALDWRSGAFPKGFADIFGTLQSDGTQTHTLQLSRYYTNGSSRTPSAGSCIQLGDRELPSPNNRGPATAKDKSLMELIWLKLRKYGCISLGISLVEILVIWGGTAMALATPQLNWRPFRTVMICTYTFGFIGSLLFSVVGLAGDSRRIPAALALATTVVNLVICSVPIAY